MIVYFFSPNDDLISSCPLTGDSDSSASQCRRVFDKGLKFKTETIISPIISVPIVECSSGRSRGFGYVTFATVEDAKAALASEHFPRNRALEVKIATSKEMRAPSKKKSPGYLLLEFRSHFDKFGEITDLYMPKDPSTKGNCGIGFNTFAIAGPVLTVGDPGDRPGPMSQRGPKFLEDVVISPSPFRINKLILSLALKIILSLISILLLYANFSPFCVELMLLPSLMCRVVDFRSDWEMPNKISKVSSSFCLKQ
ncbi:unnamed protein product [Lactuca saligna]|uniref:RRM domain-containing protein n=1 Tax=Lactuca saligna TaxID=75948 RepID=A0AA35Y8U4_LACSI|nr:unnamed protein product [Lactuca saligna]